MTSEISLGGVAAMTSEISTDVPRSDVAVDATYGRNIPPIVLMRPHIDVLRSSDIEDPAIIQPGAIEPQICLQVHERVPRPSWDTQHLGWKGIIL